MSTLQATLDSYLARYPRKIDLGLERIEAVLDRLGRPQDNLPPAIHIAGTNGKGSTTALLRAMVEASGANVHVYTSPHLVRFNERIVLGGVEATDDQILDAMKRVDAAIGNSPLTFYEATTAAAFLLFAEHPADYAIIEVGLGGRFDGTNVFTPRACAITPIDYDHAEFLGRDLAGIAREKAGIIKPNAPVFIGPQRELVDQVLSAEARKMDAPAAFWGQDFRAYGERGRLTYETPNEVLDLPLPALQGRHQVMNAGLAIAVALDLGLSTDAIETGLQTAKWPARMQRLTSGPMVEIATDDGAEVWLDGGHNPHAAQALAAFMGELETHTQRPLILLMGILANKDAGGYLGYFEGLASGLVAVSIDGHSALSPETLSELAGHRGMATVIGNNLTDAMQKALNMGQALSRQTADEPIIQPRILICGSLYLAGEVLRENS